MAAPKHSAQPATQSLHSRKRWLYILPAVFVTYSLAYVDRANYGFGAAAGLAKTLNITASQSALLASLFFLGYFLFQVPGAALARRHSARFMIFLALITWGCLASLTGVIRSFWLLAFDRLLLGAAESFIFPAMLILLTNWFTRAERSRTNTILMLGNPVTVLWMSVVTGYLIKAVGWQMAFVIEGLPSVFWGLIWLAVIRDHPIQAPWMSPESSQILNEQLQLEQSTLPKISGIGAALSHPGVLLLTFQYFFWSLGLYGFVLWLPTIIQAGASKGIAITGLLSAVPYILAITLMIVVSQVSDRHLRRKGLIWPFLIVAGSALAGSYYSSSLNFWWAYALLILAGGCMYAPYGPFFAIIPEILPKNVAGEVTALVNSCGALGAFAGTWLVGLLQARTHNSSAGFLLMSVALVISGILIGALKTPQMPSQSRPPVTLNRLGRLN